MSQGLKGAMRTCSSWSPTDLRRPRVWTWDIPPTFSKLNTVNCRQKTWSTLFSNNPRWRQHLIHLLVCASKQRKGWGLHLDWNPLILSFWIIPTRRFKWIQYIHPVLNQGFREEYHNRQNVSRSFHFRPWSLWGPCKHKRAVRTGAGTPIRSFANK